MENINKNQETNISELPSINPSGMLKRWNTVLNTCNFPQDVKKPDLITKWLVIIRACVFSMTLFSGLVGGFLAIWAAELAGMDIAKLNWINFILATFAIVLAHAVNNMLNDYFDYKTGLDDSEYARAMYAPHPIIAGLTTEKKLLSVVLLFNVIFLIISAYLAFSINNPIVFVFMILGLFLSFAYVAPPFYFKKRGLGEISVFFVWGILMTGVVFLVTYGQVNDYLELFLMTAPYAITVTTVIMGKHIDKYPADIKKGIHTLPVLVGEKLARHINQLLMISFYVLILGMVVYNILGMGVLLVFLALPRLFKAVKLHSEPKPLSPPEGWPVWPLWLVSWAFWHNKLAGGLFVLGLIINVIVGPHFSLLSTYL